MASETAGKVCTHCTICEGELNVRNCDHPDYTKLSNFALVEGKKMIYSATCGVCGGVGEFSDINQEGLRVLTPDALVKGAPTRITHTTDVDADAKNMPYYHAVAAEANEGRVQFGVVDNVGKYIAILYRKNYAATSSVYNMEMFVHNTSTKKYFSSYVDNNWHLAVLDFSDKFTTIPEGGYGMLRFDMFDPFNTTVTAGDVTDIAYIGFFTSENAAVAYYAEYLKAYLGSKACDHRDDNTWVASETAGKVCTHCTICESELNAKACDHPDITRLSNVTPVEGKKMTYSATCGVCGGVGEFTNINQEGLRVFQASEFGADAARATCTQEEDENGISHAHVVAKNTGKEIYCYLNSDPAATMESNKYIAVIYKKTTAGDTGMKLWIGAPGVAAGSIPNPTCRPAKTVLNNDNEWDILILENKNTDVTKTGVLRLDYFVGNAYTQGDVVDIACAGFFSTFDSAWDYFDAFVEAYGLSYPKNPACPRYVSNFSGSLCKVNGTAGAFGGGRYTDTVKVMDADAVVLNSADSIALGGWFITPAGTDYYSFRVVKEDGVAVVKAPVPWVTNAGGNGGAAGVGEARGWTQACGTHCNIASTPIDLSAYAGKTVTVEIVAHTNLGMDIVWARIENVHVPAAE